MHTQKLYKELKSILWAETLRNRKRLGREKNVTVMGSFLPTLFCLSDFCILNYNNWMNVLLEKLYVIERIRNETGSLWKMNHLSRLEQRLWGILEMEKWKRRLVIAFLASRYYFFMTFTHLPLTHGENMNKKTPFLFFSCW